MGRTDESYDNQAMRLDHPVYGFLSGTIMSVQISAARDGNSSLALYIVTPL